MNVVQENTGLQAALVEQFNQFETALAGKAQSPIHTIRKEAINRFRALGFPTTKHEEWKYTNVNPILKQSFDLSRNKPVAGFTGADAKQFFFHPEEANVLLFVNGEFVPEYSKILSPAHELTLMPLAEAIEKNVPQVDEHLGRLAKYDQDAFAALNTGFAQQGAFIHIPTSKVVERPTVLYYIADSSRGNVISQPRNLIVAGKNSQATIIEVFASKGAETSLTNTLTEIYVAQDAVLDHYKAQLEGTTANHIGTTQVYQEGKTNFSNTTVTLSGGLVRNNLNIELDAEYCEAYMNGLYLLDGKMHVDNHTLVDHRMPNSYSNEFYKGVMAEKSNGVFNGKIFVRQDAQKTNAFQSNRNLLLSDEASINAKPQLEIFADDVKCSHGATIGQLDEEAMFYLRARGLDKEGARALLLQAFANDVLEKIKPEFLREHLEALAEQKLIK